MGGRLMAKRVAVVGFGKIGQAVAAQILNAGLEVVAIDINPGLVKLFRDGRLRTPEPGVESSLLQGHQSGKLQVFTEFKKIEDCSAVLVSIPLLVDNQKKVLYETFDECIQAIAPHLREGAVLSIETSLPLGAARNRVLPMIEACGRVHGVDFFLIHSPERIKSGTMLHQLRSTLKVVGGIDSEALLQGLALYRSFLPPSVVVPVESIEAAEMIKLAGMIYRDVNIALSNQLAKLCTQWGLDIQTIIARANTDGEASLLQPGIGVGGHCTPVYPYFLIDAFRQGGECFSLAEAAREINDGMAEYAIRLLEDRLELKKVLLLGLSFRPGVKEDTFSTAFLLRESLKRRGSSVFLHDPLYSPEELVQRGFIPSESPYEIGAEAVIVVTAHSQFRDLDFERLRQLGCRVFLDGRNEFDPAKVQSHGIEYIGIGRSISCSPLSQTFVSEVNHHLNAPSIRENRPVI